MLKIKRAKPTKIHLTCNTNSKNSLEIEVYNNGDIAFFMEHKDGDTISVYANEADAKKLAETLMEMVSEDA